jgi:acetyl esterase
VDGSLPDAALARFLAAIREEPGSPARLMGVRSLREASARRAASRPRGPGMAEVRDLVVDGAPPVRVRLYRPSSEPLPLLVYFHGGGWTIGDLDSHDRICRRLAGSAAVAVLAVDYRRAPEDRWPAAVDDAITVVRWAREHATTLTDDRPIGVCGDSAGGNIAALCCLRLKDSSEPQPAVQASAYPNTDLTFSQSSVVEKATGWGLDADDARWFAEQWVPDPALRADPRVSPLRETDLGGLAPAIVVTAEHDVLRDEGNAYATALAAAGVSVTHRCEVGLVHGFLGLDVISPVAAEAGERFFADIRREIAKTHRR